MVDTDDVIDNTPDSFAEKADQTIDYYFYPSGYFADRLAKYIEQQKKDVKE